MENNKKDLKKGTTIAVDIATSEALDTYCREKNILKKDFVRLAVKWVNDMDIDLTSETMYAPLEPDKSEADEAALPAIRDQFGQIAGVLSMVPEFVASAKSIGELTSENRILSERVKQQGKEIEETRTELEEVKRLLEMAKGELRHCKGTFASANKEVLKELGIK